MKFFDKGKALFEKGEYVKARLEFKNALQMDAKFSQGYYMLGRVEMKTKNPKGAFSAFSKAVALNPDLLDAQIELGRFFLAAKEMVRAMEKADLVLSKEPDNEDALLLKSVCLLRTDKRAEGENILNALIQKNPLNPEPYLVLARSRAADKDLEGACKPLLDFLKKDRKNIQIRLMLAGIMEKRKDYKEAEAQYRMLVSETPSDDQLKILLARFYGRQNRDGEAENIHRELMAAHPENQVYCLELARFFGQKKDRDAMTRVLQGCIDSTPEGFKAYEMLALALLSGQRYDEALEVVDRFMARVKTGPEFLRAKLIKATLYFREKKMAAALKLVGEILDENPGDVKAHALKGDLEDHKGRLRRGHCRLPLCTRRGTRKPGGRNEPGQGPLEKQGTPPGGADLQTDCGAETRRHRSPVLSGGSVCQKEKTGPGQRDAGSGFEDRSGQPESAFGHGATGPAAKRR